MPKVPEQLPLIFERAFNTRDFDLFEQLFDPEAMLVVGPGDTVTGEPMRSRCKEVLHDAVPITVQLRHVYVAGDIALLINDYVHEGVERDGSHVRIEGTATDVARRGPDGSWRYLIDNPSGTARRRDRTG